MESECDDWGILVEWKPAICLSGLKILENNSGKIRWKNNSNKIS